MRIFIRASLVTSGLILLGAGCARYKTYEAPTAAYPPTLQEAATPAPAQDMKEAVIEYRDGEFNPGTLRVLQGTRVTFVNKGSKEVWPASGRHPTHEICPGFDALKGLKQGETYSYVFDKTADCPFHNHLAPTERGSIEVKAEE